MMTTLLLYLAVIGTPVAVSVAIGLACDQKDEVVASDLSPFIDDRKISL